MALRDEYVPVAESIPYDNGASGLAAEDVQLAIDELSFDIQNPVDLTMANVGFEDFMFDAYAGAGGNDNQYSFTPETNNGSSNIDGAVTVVGNDYEGIHTLDTLAVATSRPLVAAFNNVNRIKLGAQQEVWQIRVRINQLATTAEKYTARFGLMDMSTIGQPANGVLFSYDPVYPVTAVAQVVTATPNSFPVATYQVVTGTPDVSSHNPSQTFTQTLNGTPYTYNYSTPQVITVTPNSFPAATYQQISVAAWTRSNNTLYTITINGTVCSYTSDASATDAEIATGLVTAINASAQSSNVLAAGSAKPFTVTSKILGRAFTYSGSANITTITLVTANVPVAVYTQTINGVNYQYTSDGTPTAAEVVSGLTTLINADGSCPAAASGTTTLILTGKVSGASWTYSGTANLTQADTTANPVAATIVTALKTLINADGPLPITASGTNTLILTSDILGTAFTYSSTSNLPDVLTTANTPIEVYTQTVGGTPYVYTSDGTPTATEVCNGLRARMVADSSVNVSGTTTLIMTAKVAGTPFTYSGSSNLTEVLTTANVVGVAYSGNWIANVVNTSTTTAVNSGIPTVAGAWCRLKAIITSASSGVYFYVNDVQVAYITAPTPTAGLRFVFKLEKTLGTTSRSCDIDYIAWRRVRD